MGANLISLKERRSHVDKSGGKLLQTSVKDKTDILYICYAKRPVVSGHFAA